MNKLMVLYSIFACMKLLLSISIIGLLLLFNVIRNKNEAIESQNIRILFLSDYRDAYMTHFDSCHCHDNCFNWPNYMNKQTTKK